MKIHTRSSEFFLLVYVPQKQSELPIKLECIDNFSFFLNSRFYAVKAILTLPISAAHGSSHAFTKCKKRISNFHEFLNQWDWFDNKNKNKPGFSRFIDLKIFGKSQENSGFVFREKIWWVATPSNSEIRNGQNVGAKVVCGIILFFEKKTMLKIW